MKNILDEKPNGIQSGRFKRVFTFMDTNDILNKSILDVGCGYGWFELDAFKKGAKHIDGIEISEEDLLTIKKHIKTKKFSSKVGSAIKIPYKSSTFNTVVAWEVLEHIPKGTESDFFSEVYRVLKKGGSFYLSTPHDFPLSTYLDPAFWIIGHRHYSKNKLRSYAIGKFKVEKMEIYGGPWTSLSLLNMYMSKWIFKRQAFFQSFFAKKEYSEYTKKKSGYFNIFCKYKRL